MSAIKSITVQVDTDEACPGRVSYAAATAARFGAGLRGVFAKGTIGNYGAYDFISDVNLLELRQSAMNEAAQEAEKAFREAAGAAKDVSFHVEEGAWDRAIPRHAHVSDLLIIAQPNTGDERATAPSSLAGDAVMSAGIPIVVVPYIGAKAEAPKTVVVSWKDSREATRAVRDAMPFMEGAKVHVLTVGEKDDSGSVSGKDVTAYLTQHGIDAEYSPSVVDDMSVGDVILSRISDFSADMVVMGGYSHNRWRETILGGVTRSLLGHMTVPVLMSH